MEILPDWVLILFAVIGWIALGLAIPAILQIFFLEDALDLDDRATALAVLIGSAILGPVLPSIAIFFLVICLMTHGGAWLYKKGRTVFKRETPVRGQAAPRRELIRGPLRSREEIAQTGNADPEWIAHWADGTPVTPPSESWLRPAYMEWASRNAARYLPPRERVRDPWEFPIQLTLDTDPPRRLAEEDRWDSLS